MAITSDADADGRFGDAVTAMIERRGGSTVGAGSSRHVFIGDVDARDRDTVVLVRYPSRPALLETAVTPEHQEAHVHREGGLADTVGIACAPAPGVVRGDAS